MTSSTTDSPSITPLITDPAAQLLQINWLTEKATEKHIAYDLDCYKLFAAIRQRVTETYYFESLALPRHQDRYLTMGFSPALIFEAKGNQLHITGTTNKIYQATGHQLQAHGIARHRHSEAENNTAQNTKITNHQASNYTDSNSIVSIRYQLANPYTFLKEHLTVHLTKSLTSGHQSGLVGYFAYEAVNYFEPSLKLAEHPQFSTFKLGLYTDGVIYDTTTGTLSYYTFAEDRSDFVSNICQNLHQTEIPEQLKSITFKGHNQTQETFTAAVNRTKTKINTGYSFQAEVGFKSNYHIEGDKLAIYSRLRQVNPGPYMYYLQFGQEELLGASPEILLSNKQGVLLTTPTAGTIARGKSPEEDTQLARHLLSDTKEIAEHNMLVDLHRNDLAKVCMPGSIKIADLMYIIKFSHVQHIVSNIIGLLRHDQTAFDALEAIFPGGVVTGAPKIETIKIINDNEKQPRGPYGGAVGRFAFNGDCEFCLPIRSIFCYGDEAYIQTSAGVVYDSIAEKEYQEVNNKLAAMKQVLEQLNQVTTHA